VYVVFDVILVVIIMFVDIYESFCCISHIYLFCCVCPDIYYIFLCFCSLCHVYCFCLFYIGFGPPYHIYGTLPRLPLVLLWAIPYYLLISRVVLFASFILGVVSIFVSGPFLFVASHVYCSVFA